MEFKDMRSQYTKKDPFCVLGLEVGCTLQHVKDAYRSQALQLHPDKPSGTLSTAEQTELFQLLSVAYVKIRTGPEFKRLLARQDGAGSNPEATNDEDEDLEPTQKIHKRVVDAKDKLAASRQEALHSKWAEELQDLLRKEEFELNRCKLAGRVREAIQQEERKVYQVDVGARSQSKMKHGKAQGKMKNEKAQKKSAQQDDDRSKVATVAERVAKRFAAAHDPTGLLKTLVQQELKAHYAAEDLRTLHPVKDAQVAEEAASGRRVVPDRSSAPSRPQATDMVGARTQTAATRKDRFAAKTYDPLKSFRMVEDVNGAKSLNARMLTAEDEEEDPALYKVLSARLQEQYHLTGAAKATKLESQACEEGKSAAEAGKQATVSREKRIEFLQERLKAVGSVGQKPMAARTRKALLSGRGNAALALPSEQERQRSIWEKERRQIMLEGSLLTADDLCAIAEVDYCLRGTEDDMCAIAQGDYCLKGGDRSEVSEDDGWQLLGT